jgi:hypothetical protein
MSTWDEAPERDQDQPPTLKRRIGRDGRVLPRDGMPGDKEWEIELEFTPHGGTYRPSRLVLQPGVFSDEAPPEGITARLLHAIRLGELVDQFTREHLGDLAAGARFFGRSAEPQHALPPPANRPGPRGYGEAFYVEVAQEYLEAHRSDPRRPIEKMAPRYPGYSKANIRDWVARARHKGYLGEPGQGRPGGLPTKKLLDALQDRPGGRGPTPQSNGTDRATEERGPGGP